MLTLVCVTCLKDIELFKRWLTTTLWAWQDLGEIIIVVNEDGSQLEVFKALAQPIIELRHRSIPIRWFTGQQILKFKPGKWDWYSQQQIKLYIADHVATEWFVIHDSKNYYINPADTSVFLTDDRRPRRSTVLCKNYITEGMAYHREYRGAYRIWDLELLKQPWIIKHNPPSVFNTQSIRNMLVYLRSRYGDLYPHLTFLMGHSGQLYTEFSLISAWLTHTGEIDQYQHTEDGPFTGISNWISSSKDLRDPDKMSN